jgi:caa(3)-type oxidase subunit IV
MKTAPVRTARGVLVTGGALLLLWAVSLGLSYVELGSFALAVALGIGGLKALLVVVVFMELLRERASTKLAIATGGVLALALAAFMLADVSTRDPAPPIGRVAD